VNGVSDHVHLLIGYKPSLAIPDLVRDVKNNSSSFINERHFSPKRFSWQEGYGFFSYSPSQIKDVYNYILNQEAHHKDVTFRYEYLDFLKQFEVDHDETYVFG
jgi:putative transposase